MLSELLLFYTFSSFITQIHSTTNQFPIALTHLLKVSIGDGDFPLKLDKDGLLLYDLRKPTLISEIEVLLSNSTCSGLLKVSAFVSNSTKDQKMVLGGFKKCKTGIFADENIRIPFENVGFARFVQLEFSVEEEVDFYPVVSEIKLYTREMPFQAINAIEENSVTAGKSRKIYIKPTKVRKIGLQMDNSFDFSRKGDYPELEILLQYSPKDNGRFAKCQLKAVPEHSAFETILPEGIVLTTLKINRIEKFASARFYTDAILEKPIVPENGHLKEDKPIKVFQIEFTDVEPGEKTTRRLIYSLKGEKKQFVVFADNPRVDLNLEMDQMHLMNGMRPVANFRLYVDPCSNYQCQNGGICVIDSDFNLGYGCICKRGFFGHQCEEAVPQMCVDMGNDVVTFSQESFYEGEMVSYKCGEGEVVENEFICRNDKLFKLDTQEYVEVDGLCE